LKSLLAWLVPRFLKFLIDSIGSTVRPVIVEGEDVFRDLLANRRSVIFSFWHNRIFYAAYFIYSRLFRKGYPLMALISQSKDGKLIARVVELWGGKVARGSTSKGGKEAMFQMLRAIRKEGYSVVTTPDGPRGPKYHFQEGTIALAQMTGIEIIPVTFSAEKYWQLRSWDSFIIPKPFSKIYVSFLPPIRVDRDLTPENFENIRKQTESIMVEQSTRIDSMWNAK